MSCQVEKWAWDWCAERELVLLKVNAPPGPQRTEVMQLLDIFRARCIDVSEISLTVCVSGDAGKVNDIATNAGTLAAHPFIFQGIQIYSFQSV